MKGLKDFIIGNRILNNPVNNSKAKYHYSFSKSKRFTNNKNNSVDVFYNVPNQKNNRTTTFGYGNRSNFGFKKDKIPDPGVYNISKEFVMKNKNFSFGTGRVFLLEN